METRCNGPGSVPTRNRNRIWNLELLLTPVGTIECQFLDLSVSNNNVMALVLIFIPSTMKPYVPGCIT